MPRKYSKIIVRGGFERKKHEKMQDVFEHYVNGQMERCGLFGSEEYCSNGQRNL